MTVSPIQIPGYVTMVTADRRDIRGLASYAAGLLADTSDLPAPRYFSVSEGGQEICLQFGDDPGSFRALALWAERFGGTVTGQPHTRSDGHQSIHCQVKFTADGVTVEAYAFVTPATDAPTAT